MDENTFVNMFDHSIIQNFSQSVSSLPFQNINFFPPTPPQQMHLYPKDNVQYIDNTSLIEDINHSSYNIEPTDCNMNPKQVLLPFSLEVEHKNILLTPSPSTETCSSSAIHPTGDIFQDFSLYPSNYTSSKNNPVDQASAFTTTNSGYACHEICLQVSPRSSCSSQVYYEQQFYTDTNDNKKGKTASLNKKKHYCQICNKSFGRPQELQRHQVCHTGVRNFFCPNCTKSFARRDAMQRHYKSHFKDKSRSTARAGKAFY